MFKWRQSLNCKTFGKAANMPQGSNLFHHLLLLTKGIISQCHFDFMGNVQKEMTIL